MKTAASTLARSRTAWSALASAVLAVAGTRLGLSETEVGILVAALQGVIATLYITDTRSGKHRS